jgi:hypothetical protein
MNGRMYRCSISVIWNNERHHPVKKNPVIKTGFFLKLDKTVCRPIFLDFF